MIATVLDLLTAFMLLGFVVLPLVPQPLRSTLDGGPAVLVMLTAWFTAFWASPLAAAPVQLLCGLRVVDLHGRRLRPLRALARGVLTLLLIAGVMCISGAPGRPWLWAVAVAALAALFLAAFGRTRQALHDRLLGTLVVRRSALREAGAGERLQALATAAPGAPGAPPRPRVAGVLADAAVLGGPLAAYVIAAYAMHDRELMGRVIYAIEETAPLKRAIETYHAEHGSLPDAASLGDAARGAYPDGGYYQLGGDGRIHIRFEVLPPLRRGAITLTPEIGTERIEWRCSTTDGFDVRYVPSTCR